MDRELPGADQRPLVLWSRPVRELSPGEYSAYRDDAESYRRRKGDTPTNGLTQGEWEELCEAMAQYWECFAERQEQAIREGQGQD